MNMRAPVLCFESRYPQQRGPEDRQILVEEAELGASRSMCTRTSYTYTWAHTRIYDGSPPPSVGQLIHHIISSNLSFSSRTRFVPTPPPPSTSLSLLSKVSHSESRPSSSYPSIPFPKITMKFSTIAVLATATTSTHALTLPQSSNHLAILPIALSVSIFHASTISAFAIPRDLRAIMPNNILKRDTIE